MTSTSEELLEKKETFRRERCDVPSGGFHELGLLLEKATGSSADDFHILEADGDMGRHVNPDSVLDSIGSWISTCLGSEGSEEDGIVSRCD